MEHPSMHGRLLHPREAADLLCVSVDTLRRWEREGKILASRSAGGVRRFPFSEVERIRKLTADDFRKSGKSAEDEGFVSNEPETTLGNVLQKFAAQEQAKKDIANTYATIRLSQTADFPQTLPFSLYGSSKTKE